MKIPTILEDERPIIAVYWVNGDQCSVGVMGVTAIKAYGECGSEALMPWLAVFHGEEISSRFSAQEVEIVYRIAS